MGDGLETLDYQGQRFSAGWRVEDFLSEPHASPAVFDPWVPITPLKLQENLAKVELHKSAVRAHATDPWCPVEFTSAIFENTLQGTDFWFETVNLPAFDRSARRTFWALGYLNRPLTRDAKSKATWIIAILQPVTMHERTRWLRAFEEVFLEFTRDRFFRKVRDLAGQANSAEALLAAIQLRSLWEDRFDLRQVRAPGRFGIVYTLGPNIAWNNALRIASARGDYETEEMIESDWLDDWHRLKRHADGYWSFADYACLRAQNEEFEDWDVPAEVFREEARWLPRRTTPAEDRSGTSVGIRSGSPPVPAELARRFHDWREKQGYLLKPVNALVVLAKSPPPNVGATASTDSPPPSEVSMARSSFKPELNESFESLKREMQVTLTMARQDPGKGIRPPTRSPTPQ